MTNPRLSKGLTSRAILAASSVCVAVVAALAAPAWAQLRPTDATNSVLVDLSAIEGAGPMLLGGAPVPFSGPLGGPMGSQAGNLQLPPVSAPQSRLLAPGAAAPRGALPPATLRLPDSEPRGAAQRPPASRGTGGAPVQSPTKSAAKGKSGAAPVQSVERSDRPAQPMPLPDVALPLAPTLAPTPPPAIAAPPAPQQQMAAVPPPAAKATPKSEPAPKSAKSSGPTPPPRVAPPKPPEATPPPAPAPAAQNAPAQAAPPPQQQAALPERAPAPRGAAPAPESLEIRFAAGDANLSDDGKARLDKLTDSLKTNENSRIQLLAYAGEDQISPSKARRLSLSRALSVRSYLIGKGIRSTRIDVRALGDQVPGGDPTRVELKIADR